MFNNTSFPCKPKKKTKKKQNIFFPYTCTISHLHLHKKNNIQIYKQSFSVVSELDQSELDSQFFLH